MADLNTTSRFSDPDGAFRALMLAHRGLDAPQSAALNARLVLLLANHIGDGDVLVQAIAQAVAAGEPTTTDAPPPRAPG